MTAINSHSSRQLLRNNMSFTLCSIHILFISNEFHKFWMSFDFKNKCTKNGQKWAKTQAGLPLLGRPAWHPYTCCHVFDPGQCDMSTMPLSRGLDVGLIEWTKRLAQGLKDPQLNASSCPSHQSTSQEDHKHTSATSVQRRAERSQREAGRPSTCRR